MFALSRIAVFQNNDTVAKACLSLLMHANAEVRQVAPVALSHVITKGAPAAGRLLAELESLLLHADRNGVANIPGDLVREVALGCEKLVAAEEEILGYARSAKAPTVEELAAAHKRCRDRFARLPDEVRAELA